MFESLFGAEMPLAIRFFLAFLIVLGLIVVTAWVVRRFGTGRLGGTTVRGRQPRLGVIDYASVDARRRLILVRRDNVEHLLMIGGPTDVVVESNIVRAVQAPREVTAGRPPGAVETLPRAIPVPENGHGSWPLQPESTPTRPAPRLEPEEPSWPLPMQPLAEPPKRPQREALAALADELSARPVSPRRTSTSPRSQSPEPHTEPAAEAVVQAEAQPAAETRIESSIAAVQTEPVDPAAADKSLAEMAHRLEAALRKPSPQADGRNARSAGAPAAAPHTTSAVEAAAPTSSVSASAPARNAPRPADAKPARTDAKPSQGKTLYENLEQEMASLLGRPTNKTG
jgi:flagellar protein FliO/FliZ